MRLSHAFIIGLIGISALAGCSNANQGTMRTPPTASNSSSGGIPNQEGYKTLLGVVSNTEAAVEAGDFTKAKAEFNNFEKNWKQVEDGVKVKSPASYKAIEDSLNQVNGEFRGSQPGKQNVLTALQSLRKTISSVTTL